MTEGCKMFYPNKCFICCLTSRDVELKKCGCCKLVSYCSKSHQRKDWNSHKEFCVAARCTEKHLYHLNLRDSKSWFKFRMNHVTLCEIKLGRKLRNHEWKMILFRSNCHVCHKITNVKPCLNCLSVSYCSNDHKIKDSYNHRSICNTFSFGYEILLYEEKHPFYLADDDISFRKGDLILTDDMKEFLKTNGTGQRNVMDKEIQEALVSEYLTCPLTLMYALQKIGYSIPKHDVLHVVGSSERETSVLFSWDITFLIQKHVKEIVIHFVGPDAKTLMDLALLYEGKAKFKFSDKLYHDFVKSEEYEKPDIICAFNCGFHEFDGVKINTWKQSLPFFVDNNQIQFIFTSFTKDEVDQDLNELLMVKPNIKADIERNPFSGLRPHWDPEDLGVFFINAYLGIVKNTNLIN